MNLKMSYAFLNFWRIYNKDNNVGLWFDQKIYTKESAQK